MKINAGVNGKNWLIWNRSNWEWECDKWCDIGEYLDYENCKCRKKVVDKVVEECTETDNEVKLAKITLCENENEYKLSSCTLYIMLSLIIFTIKVGIGTYFVYYKYMDRNKETDRKEKLKILFFKQQLLDVVYWTYK